MPLRNVGKPEQPDRVIERIAATQHGVILRRQALAAGLHGSVIDRRIASGMLYPLHRGVFRVGPVASPHARDMAAVLACGEHAVLSHCSAAVRWGMMPSTRASVDVTVPRNVRRRVAGIATHRARVLDGDERTLRDGIPLTAPLRTVLDLALVLPTPDLERAIATAERAGIVRMEELTRRVNNLASPTDATVRPPHPGAPRIRLLLRATGVSFTRSGAEVRLLEIVRLGRLPRPRVNTTLLGYEVDFLWMDQRLVVEVDGFAYHSSERAFARDRRRDAELTTAGFNVVRFTWDDLSRHPEATLVMLAQALQRPQVAVCNGRRG